MDAVYAELEPNAQAVLERVNAGENFDQLILEIGGFFFAGQRIGIINGGGYRGRLRRGGGFRCGRTAAAAGDKGKRQRSRQQQREKTFHSMLLAGGVTHLYYFLLLNIPYRGGFVKCADAAKEKIKKGKNCMHPPKMIRAGGGVCYRFSQNFWNTLSQITACNPIIINYNKEGTQMRISYYTDCKKVLEYIEAKGLYKS